MAGITPNPYQLRAGERQTPRLDTVADGLAEPNNKNTTRHTGPSYLWNVVGGCRT